MAVNGKWYVGFPRWTHAVSWSGGSYEALYPVSNLGSLPFANVARASDNLNASTIAYGVLPQRRLINLFMICGDNISEQGRIKITLYGDDVTSSPPPTPLVQTEWIRRYDILYDESSPFASWDSGNWWDRTYTREDRAGSRQYKHIIIEGGYYAKSFMIEIDDENNPDGYVQIGILEVATAMELDPVPQVGADYGFFSRTLVTQAQGGGKYFDRLNNPRFFSGTIPYYNRNSALSTFYELIRRNDIDVPFAFIPDSEDTTNAVRNIFLARNYRIDPFTRMMIDRDGLPINFEEVL
jgi:hypothetical protein